MTDFKDFLNPTQLETWEWEKKHALKDDRHYLLVGIMDLCRQKVEALAIAMKENQTINFALEQVKRDLGNCHESSARWRKSFEEKVEEIEKLKQDSDACLSMREANVRLRERAEKLEKENEELRRKILAQSK